MAFNVKRVVLNPRAYLTPFILLLVFHHVPMLIAYGAIARPRDFTTCDPVRELFTWFDIAFVLHLVSAALLLLSCATTLGSPVYRVHKPENAIILLLFLFYVTHLVWALYGESAFPADTSDCATDSDAIQGAADDITYFQHFDFAFSLTVVVVASCTSYLCGVHAGTDVVEAEKRWQRRCMNMFRMFTCRSARSHATDDNIFESLGQLLGKFLVVRYRTDRYEGLQFTDLMFCLGLVSKAQKEERDATLDAELAARKRFPRIVEETTLRDLSFYARLAIGMYGWPIYVWYRPLKWFRIFGCFPWGTHTGGWHNVDADDSDDYDNDAETGDAVRRQTIVEHDNIVTSNRKSFVSYTGIDASALVYLNCYNFVFSSPYSIVKDRQRRELIVSVRGSSSFYDFITDGLAHNVTMEPHELPSDVPDAHATVTHYGMLRTARSIYGDLQEGTRESLFWNFALAHCREGAAEPWTIVICGHSMGGGVSGILCLLLRRTFPSTRAFLYAPPMMFDPATAQYTKKFMTTAVFGDDIVSRLSIANVLRLRDEMIDHFNAVAAEKLYKVRYGSKPRKTTLATEVGQLAVDATASSQAPTSDDGFDNATTPTNLVGGGILRSEELDTIQERDVPGQIIHIFPAQQARTCGCTMLRGEQELTYSLREASYFRRIRVTSRALQDHMVHHYDRNIQHLAANCLGISLANEANQVFIPVAAEDAEEAAAAEERSQTASQMKVQVSRPPVLLESAPSYDVIGDFQPATATDPDEKRRVRTARAVATPRHGGSASDATPYKRIDDVV